MNDPVEKTGMADVSKLWLVLEELEEGTLDQARSDELAALLGESPAARRAYLEYFQQSAVLRMEAAKLHEHGLLPFVESAAQTRRAIQRSVLAAAAMVALAAILAALIAVARPGQEQMSADVAAETRWSIDGVPQGSGKDPLPVKEGATVQVFSGTLKLETDEGDRLVVQGPAEVSFPTLYQPQVHEGWLWIDTADSGEPFEVGARSLRIRDIGTRFGVRVPVGGATEVHLVDGELEVTSARDGRRLSGLKDSGKAFAFTSNGVGDELSMAPDPFPGLPDLLMRPPNYRTMIFSQSPSGYWTLDKAEAEDLSNAILGRPPAYCGPTVRDGEPGPGSGNAFHGLPADNRSLYMPGVTEHSVLAGLDGSQGVNQREGAVSFWIRREPTALQKGEILWLAGLGEDSFGVPSETILHTRLETSGQVMFEVKTGDATLNLLSPGSIVDGRWHQVVASWGAKAVDLYIDGNLAGHDARFRKIKDGNLRGRFVRFGKPSLDQQEIFNAFSGWVDEISLWERPLSALEVRCQFEAAVGAAED